MNSKQTNKQTPSSSSCWSITAYNEERELLNRIINGESELLPDFVLAVYGGEEKCPKTETLHFQGCLQTRWCRFTQVKKWLPTAHIEKARSKDALKKYAMKEETSTGRKAEIINDSYITIPKLIETLIRLYRVNSKDLPNTVGSKLEVECEWQWLICEYIKRYGIEHIVLLTDPRLFRTWKMTARTLYCMLEEGKL